jgi:hypothetical protein
VRARACAEGVGVNQRPDGVVIDYAVARLRERSMFETTEFHNQGAVSDSTSEGALMFPAASTATT